MRTRADKPRQPGVRTCVVNMTIGKSGEIGNRRNVPGSLFVLGRARLTYIAANLTYQRKRSVCPCPPGVGAGQFAADAFAQLPANYCPDACGTDGWDASAPGTIYQPVPTSLSIVAGTDSTTSEATCSAGSFGTGCGVVRTFTYQVNDQQGKPIQTAGLQVWDAITTTSPNNLNLTGYITTCTGTPAGTNGGPCNVTTNSLGQFGIAGRNRGTDGTFSLSRNPL
jgi:hypothetical protein